MIGVRDKVTKLPSRTAERFVVELATRQFGGWEEFIDWARSTERVKEIAKKYGARIDKNGFFFFPSVPDIFRWLSEVFNNPAVYFTYVMTQDEYDGPTL